MNNSAGGTYGPQPPDKTDTRTDAEIREQALEALRDPETFARALRDYDQDGSLRWELAETVSRVLDLSTEEAIDDLARYYRQSCEVLADAVVGNEIVVRGVNDGR